MGSKQSQHAAAKQYLGVRVQMPVRDLLKKFRIAKGLDPTLRPALQGQAPVHRNPARDKHLQLIIGEGSFGRVYKGRKKFSGQLMTGGAVALFCSEVVALKFIPKVGRSDKELRSLRREIDIMRGLRHPNVILLLDSFDTEREVVVVTEYAEGELFQILEDDGSLPEKQVQVIACQLVSALYYLHSHRILHRDMKPQNILLGKGGVVKLCDFGYGTPLYMSPELVEEKPYDHTADLWSLGCILYELHTGAPPFYTNSIFQLVKLIVQDPVKWPESMSEDCTSFLKGLLTKDPQKRLSWPDLLYHPFVADGVLVLPDSGSDNPLTVTPSPGLQALRLQQVKEKAGPHSLEGRLLCKAWERRGKDRKAKKGFSENGQIGGTRGDSSNKPPTRRAPRDRTPSKDCTDTPLENVAEESAQPAAVKLADRMGQISRDYAKEFPSVEVGPRCILKQPHRGQGCLDSVHLENELLGGMLEGACRIRPPLRVLSNLLTPDLDSKAATSMATELGLPDLLFSLIEDILENPVSKQPSAATVLALFTQQGILVDVSPDKLMTAMEAALSSHVEQAEFPHSQFLNSDLWRFLWVRVSDALKVDNMKYFSLSGLHIFLSLALSMFTREPQHCIPLLADKEMGCVATLGHLLTADRVGMKDWTSEWRPTPPCSDTSQSSLSLMSCHLLCFPFALEVSNETMEQILQSYHRCDIVSRLLQLPLALLCRLLLCDPEHSVSTFMAAAELSGFFRPSSGPEHTDDFSPPDEGHQGLCHPVGRTASSLLSAFLNSEGFSDLAAELITVVSLTARCLLRPSLSHLYIDPALLRTSLAFSDHTVRAATCSLLGNLNPMVAQTLPDEQALLRLFQDLIARLHDESLPVRRVGCRAVGTWLGLIGRVGGDSKEKVSGPGGESTTCRVDGWVKVAQGAVPALVALLRDPDSLVRRHCCGALGNLAVLQGMTASLLQFHAPGRLLHTACTDSQQEVRLAAISNLRVFSQQTELQRALVSLDAFEKLSQVFQNAPAPHQCHWLINQLRPSGRPGQHQNSHTHR
ncbi:serine/threonine-protein kinase 36-like [Scleropages formosus]|uniref:non-specific serine/threonine protein kinase n=1 Tax=Scleropages formosus TaxID=113540 RepID=A0A0P7XV09_SCLFO|nr:serine/threonine-protein kinase 36-like [Scleropages formosus]